MALDELLRLVDDAQISEDLRQALHPCPGNAELVQRARQLGYGITLVDLLRAELLEAELVGSAGATPATQLQPV